MLAAGAGGLTDLAVMTMRTISLWRESMMTALSVQTRHVMVSLQNMRTTSQEYLERLLINLHIAGKLYLPYKLNVCT